MTWFKTNWRWAALNLFGVAVMAFVLTKGDLDWNANTFDPGLESGKWAIRFLLICLTMTPLHTNFGWSSAVKLRKPAGLWAFGFAVVHVLFYIGEAQWTWLSPAMPLYITLGALGLLILAVLAGTSNRWAMQRLKKRWKQLHRLVYVAGLAVTVHAIWATTMSKKMALRDPEAIHELNVYLAVLAVLLFVRIPAVRRLLKRTPARFRSQRQAEPVVVTVMTPKADDTPLCWPVINGRETTAPSTGPAEVRRQRQDERLEEAIESRSVKRN